MPFKDKLVYARAKLGLSQEALARELKVSFATINRWETGRTIPSKRFEMLFIDYCKTHQVIFPEQ